jgi:hypothetical protein
MARIMSYYPPSIRPNGFTEKKKIKRTRKTKNEISELSFMLCSIAVMLMIIFFLVLYVQINYCTIIWNKY